MHEAKCYKIYLSTKEMMRLYNVKTVKNGLTSIEPEKESSEIQEIDLPDKIDIPVIINKNGGHVHIGKHIFPIIKDGGYIYLKLGLFQPVFTRYEISTGLLDEEYTKTIIKRIIKRIL